MSLSVFADPNDPVPTDPAPGGLVRCFVGTDVECSWKEFGSGFGEHDSIISGFCS